MLLGLADNKQARHSRNPFPMNTPSQEPQDASEGQAAAKSLTERLRKAWVPVPNVGVGPYMVRRFVDADFKRLAQLGHPLNSISAIQAWRDNPTITGPDAYNLIWLMTRPVPQVNSVLTAGPEATKTAAEEEFSELGGLELARLTIAIGSQLNRSFPPNTPPSLEQDETAEQAGTRSPGPLREAWAPVPDIEVGPYKVRRFVDADFMRLARLGHPLNGLSAMWTWMENPIISGPVAYNIIWLMTTDVPTAKAAITAGVDGVKAAAEKKFSELGGSELTSLIVAIAFQLSRYMGARLDYEPKLREGEPGR